MDKLIDKILNTIETIILIGIFLLCCLAIL